MEYIKQILLLLFLSFSSSVFAHFDKLKNSILEVCTTADYKPVLYKLPSGQFAGVAPDILNGYARKEDFQVHYIVLSYNGLIPSLLANKCSIIATGMAATEERKKVINFTLGMYKSQSYIIYAKRNKKLINPKFLQDFNTNNLAAGIELGTIYHSFIKEKNVINKANIQIYESGSDIATALISSRIDFTFHGSQFLNSLTKANPNRFNFIKLDITNADIAFGLRKNEKILLDNLNNYIEEININGIHTQILEKNEVRFTSGY